jgi:hypothetical protein
MKCGERSGKVCGKTPKFAIQLDGKIAVYVCGDCVKKLTLKKLETGTSASLPLPTRFGPET